jgi:hypothetical protein
MGVSLREEKIIEQDCHVNVEHEIKIFEESADLRTWTIVPMATTPDGAAASYYRASAVGILSAYISAPADASRFYRLTVR